MSSLLAAWVLFPLAQLFLWFGCGSLVAALCGVAGTGRAAPSGRPSDLGSFAEGGTRRPSLSLLEGARTTVPSALVVAVGFCVVVVIGGFTTAVPALAPLTTPLMAALALVGLALYQPWRVGWPSPWLAGALLVVFAVYAAPIVLSGSATFAGYIKLDDTATWLALTDRVMEAGRSLDGLAPSSYEATLAFNLADGYPVGAFIPLGVGAALSPLDSAWLIQPHMALLALLLALSLWDLAGRLLESDRCRAAVVAISAQPALLYGYYLWGGIKELAAAALIALIASLAARGLDRERLIPLAFAIAALVGCLSLAGAVWAGPLLVAVLALGAVSWGVVRVVKRAAVLLGLSALLIAPVLVGGALLPPTSSPLDDPAAKGNLIEPLSPLQALGVWPAGDFRTDPGEMSVTIAICALAALAALGACAVAYRRRRFGLLAYLVGVPGAALAIALIGSPWVEAKALATVSPVLLFGAFLGCTWAWSRRSSALAAGIAGLIGVGVVWSNALAYSEVSLAPRDQLAELEEIGGMLAGEGPVLMSEYQPYGVRHFLRDADPEGASELRRRLVPLADGSSLAKGLWADTDDFQAEAFDPYKALVLRRSPEQSRPPGHFSLAWSGDFYEVWERDPGATAASARLPLGTGRDIAGEPRCSKVRELAHSVPGGALVAATGWEAAFAGGLGGQIALRGGRYSVWLEGSVPAGAALAVDGQEVAEIGHTLNNEGLYAELAEVELDPGRHEFSVELRAAGLAAGTAGDPGGNPRVAVRALRGEGTGLTRVPASKPGELCGRRWDWIEAIQPG